VCGIQQGARAGGHPAAVPGAVAAGRGTPRAWPPLRVQVQEHPLPCLQCWAASATPLLPSIALPDPCILSILLRHWPGWALSLQGLEMAQQQLTNGLPVYPLELDSSRTPSLDELEDRLLECREEAKDAKAELDEMLRSCGG